MSSVPFNYETVNWYTGNSPQPSELHLLHNQSSVLFQRLLLQDAMSVFKWNVPESWELNYMLYTLYCNGYVAIINTDRFGVIPQHCGLFGRGVFYQPTHVTIANPLLNGIVRPQIGKECTLIRLQPDYRGVIDLVNSYAGHMALAYQTLTTNLVNSKLSYVFGVTTPQQQQSFKKMMDKINEGESAVFVDKSLFNADGSTNWQTFTADLKHNFIAPQLLEIISNLRDKFAMEIGIPNANNPKKERMIVDEVNANNVATYSKCSQWLDSLKKGCEQANEMFKLSLSVDWRVKPELEGGDVSRETLDTGDVSV